MRDWREGVLLKGLLPASHQPGVCIILGRLWGKGEGGALSPSRSPTTNTAPNTHKQHA